jgi:2-phospho-L-lactate guanylyltransferase
VKLVILIPVKEPAHAKHRLAPLLAPAEREQIAWAMFEDLTRALRRIAAPVITVTNSPRVAERAAGAGWRVMLEAEQVSESHSVDAASRQLSREGIEAVLRLPGDLPLVKKRDVEELIGSALPRRSALMVPSWDLGGTNALLRTPPDIFPSRFGPDSLRLHTAEALRTRAHVRIIQNHRIAQDLDEPGDIARFLEQPSDTETWRLLTDLHIPERLANGAAK